MCSINHETNLTAAVNSARNKTVATAVLAKLCTAAQPFYTLRLVAQPSQYKMLSVEHF
jgi:hypothetical protein